MFLNVFVFPYFLFTRRLANRFFFGGERGEQATLALGGHGPKSAPWIRQWLFRLCNLPAAATRCPVATHTRLSVSGSGRLQSADAALSLPDRAETVGDRAAGRGETE